MEVDWFTLVLFFFFIVLPLLQQMLGKRHAPPEQPEEWEDEEEWGPHAREEQRTREQVREAEARVPTFDDWVAEDREEAPERSAWEDLGLEDIFREPQAQPRPEPRPELRPEPRPEPEYAPRPEPRHQPRPEPSPLPERWAEVPTSAPAPAPPPSRPTPVPAPAVPRVAVGRSQEKKSAPRAARMAQQHDWRKQRQSETQPLRPHAPLASILQDPDQLRRAILLTEVLGPPRSLQSPPDART